MRSTLDLLRHEPMARRFFLAHAQSSLGTGAAYVVLLVVAYDRFRSPWAISLVLLADFLPGMVLGPLFGAAADRWSRRACAVVSDLVRAAAFVGLALVDGFAGTVAFALVAGMGSALYYPAVLAALPGMVSPARSPAATALFGALADVGHTLGPALAAVALLAAGPEIILGVNGVTFAISAVILMRTDFGRGGVLAAPEAPGLSLIRAAGEGLRMASARGGVRTIILGSSAVVLFAGLFNVGELLLATEELDAGESGFSILVAVYGASVALGSLAGSRGGATIELARNYTAGILLVAVGVLASAAVPVFAVALATFAVAGLGNGLVLVHERLLLQRTVPDHMLARMFSVKETLTAWAFSISFVCGGAVASVLGTRELFVVAGGGALVVWAWTAIVLRGDIARGTLEEAEAGSPASG